MTFCCSFPLFGQTFEYQSSISGGKLWELVIVDYGVFVNLYSPPMMVDVILHATVLTTVGLPSKIHVIYDIMGTGHGYLYVAYFIMGTMTTTVIHVNLIMTGHVISV